MLVILFCPREKYLEISGTMISEDKEAERKKLRARLRIKQAQLKEEKEGKQDSSKIIKVKSFVIVVMPVALGIILL